MKFAQSWQDFMRMPENKLLKESKGIHACKQKYIQEQNKMQWYDPMIIQEASSPGQSVNNSVGADGGSTPFICGNTAEVSTLTFASVLKQEWTGSSDSGELYFDIEAYNGTVDYAAGHTNSMKKFRCYYFSRIVSSSAQAEAPSVPATIHGVVTASSVGVVGTSGHFSSSLAYQWQQALNSQVATAVVAGFTNTIAPSTLFTAATSSKGNVLTITNDKKASVAAISTTFTTTTASVATSTTALDTWFHHKDRNDRQTFDGDNLPYSNFPRKSDTATS